MSIIVSKLTLFSVSLARAVYSRASILLLDGISSTLTGGIQDIAAFLPLLGTVQCSEQVSSALTRGYLYAASTPMSIFGSLGLVIAGFKALVACFTFGNFEGAKILGNMGFEPQGENLSLIMVEVGKGKNTGRYIIETRMDELIKELNIDKNRITGVSHKSTAWNVKMMTTTALFCAFSIFPYIYLNLAPNNLKTSTRWVFPILRATGGFITATFIQLLIQRRITTLSDQYLAKQDQLRNMDVEAAVETKKHRMDAHTRMLVWPLLIGLLASLVGYVGCFSVVQNSTTIIGPISWLCLEAGLSVMRLAIWAWNPTKDDAPPLEIILELDKYEHKPLPTCNKDNAEILEYKVLPLTRARDFLKVITSFAGLIEPFSNPDLSLYYTLTRNRVNKSENVENYKFGERTLYITVFDHKERTTRVYTRNNEVDTFYSTKSDAPFVDVGHFLLEVEIDAKIDPKGDPVSSDSNILDSLRKHHRSILEHIRYRLGAADVTKTYAINNNWTMKVENTISTLKRLREENSDNWKAVVEKGREEERPEDSLASYFMHPSIERERQLLDEKRVKWITRRMEMITKETKERLLGMGVEYRVNMQAVEKKPATESLEEIEEMLGREQYYIELLLLYEVKGWEQLFWNKFKAFLDQIGNDRLEEKERLTREWRANCWKRLNPQMHAALKRLADVDMIYKDGYLEALGEQWAKSISQIFEGVEKPGLISLLELRDWIQHRYDSDEMRLRMENEFEDIEFRLKRGSDLGRFDQFWDDYHTLFECRYSQSKWLYFNQDSTVPLEVYSYALALKGNKNIIHITFGAMDSNFDVNRLLCDLPLVTSSSIPQGLFGLQLTPAIHRNLLFIRSTNNDLKTFAEKMKLDPSESSTFFFSNVGVSDIRDSGKLAGSARVLISFVAPTSGKSLILRVKHSGEEDGPLEVTLGSTKIQLNPPSKSSLTIDDINLYPNQVPGPSEFDHLSFEPEVRNDIDIRFIGPSSKFLRHGHILHDIELLDEAGLEYMPHSASLSKLSN
jgi:hypothetical protein